MRQIPVGENDANPAGTTTLLIRHAHTDAIGQWLCGRAAGVCLSAQGRLQAERLGRALSATPFAAIYTSPLDRAVETARAVAAHQVCQVEVCDELSEIEFGAWTGKSFAELDADPSWKAFNERRSTAVIPGGERAIDVQARAVRALARLGAAHAGGTIAVVSHGDVLRFAVLHYSQVSLDEYHRVEIDPASVSALLLTGDRARLLYVNNRSFAAPA